MKRYSLTSLIGGGTRLNRPGAVSVAHHGVLILNGAPEMAPAALDALRTPLEGGEVMLRSGGVTARLPARFQLVLTADPCPCGKPVPWCACSPTALRRYAQRVPGAIMARVDVRAYVCPGAPPTPAEPSRTVAERVREARDRQAWRLRGSAWTVNADLPSDFIRAHLPVPDGIELVENALVAGRLSHRGADIVVRVAWTLADMAGLDKPGGDQIVAALDLRLGKET